MFGGNTGVQSAETWTFNGTWTQHHPTVSPPGRSNFAMVHDGRRGETVVFGGVQPADTWTWDGGTWSARTGPFPAPRNGTAMAYDPLRERVVLFGGNTDFGAGTVLVSDTWEWDGSVWTQKSPAPGPSAREEHVLVWHPPLQRVLLLGGLAATRPGSLADMWAWDGTTWQIVPQGALPQPRYLHGAVFDSARGRLVLFGGLDDRVAPSLLAQTLEWDGQSWSEVPVCPSPKPRVHQMLAYDDRAGRTVLYGGGDPISARYGDTWWYGYPASFTPFGRGCAGTQGPPALSASAPILGTAFTVRVAPSRDGGVGAVVLGDSQRFWAGTRLPLDLGHAGMPGCLLFVSMVATGGLVGSGGTATWTATVPNDQALLGAPLFLQAALLDPLVVRLLVSNAGRALLGTR
jgi:hypothetical protein